MAVIAGDYGPYSNIETVPIGSVYLGTGPTLAQESGAAYEDSMPAMQTQPVGAAEVQRATSIGFLGQPVMWWGILIGLLFALTYGAKKLAAGTQDEFRSIKFSAYNTLIISLSAIIGIAFLKVVFTKWPVRGLTTFIQAV